MPRQSNRRVSLSCVPVSTSETQRPKNETRVTVIGQNPAHEKRLIADLVDFYGWKFADDGNLYAPNPQLTSAWGRVG